MFRYFAPFSDDGGAKCSIHEVVKDWNDGIQSCAAAVNQATEHFRSAEAEGKLVRLPTGDGMALVFHNSPEEPVRCALDISRALKEHPKLRVRMGIHSGPVNEVADVNERTNIAGAGINIAQRVMDCGDAGHILLSKHSSHGAFFAQPVFWEFDNRRSPHRRSS